MLTSAEASPCTSTSLIHADSHCSRIEVGLHVGWKFESIEMSADETLSAEWFLAWEYFSVETKPSIILLHLL